MNQTDRKNEKLSDLIGIDEFNENFNKCNGEEEIIANLKNYASEHGMDENRAFRALANHYYGPSCRHSMNPELAESLLKEAKASPKEIIEIYLQAAKFYESATQTAISSPHYPIYAARYYEKGQDKMNAKRCISEYIEDSFPGTSLDMIPLNVSYDLVEYTFEQYLKKMESSEEVIWKYKA